MQGGSSRHHGQDRNLLVGHNLKEGRAVSIDQPLQSVNNLLGLGDAAALHTHGLGELDEVGVGLVGVGISVLVEKVLPLGHHALLLVVEDNHLDTNVELRRGGKLSQGHVERGIAIDVDDEGIRLGHLSANGGGQTEAHGTKTTRGDHGSGVPPSEVLGSPHLVLADTGGDVGLALAVSGQVAQLLDQGLRLDEAGALRISVLVVGQGPLGLPLVDLAEPLLSAIHRAGLEVRQEVLHVGGNIALNGLGGLHNLVDVLGHNLEVDNTTTALGSGSLGGRRELGNGASDSIIETSTQGNDEISLLHGHVGVGSAVHAEHVQGLLVKLVETTETLEGGGNGDGALVGEFLEELGAALGEDHTLAGIDDGLLSNVDELGHTLDGRGELLLGDLHGGAGRGAGERRQGSLGGDGSSQNTSSDILGKINEDRAGSSAGGDLESLVDALGELGHVPDHDIPLGASTGDANDIGLLESVATNGGGDDLTAEDNHGGSVGEGILHGGDDVGGTGAGGDEDDARLARSAGIALSHVAGTLLVAGEDEVEVF